MSEYDHAIFVRQEYRRKSVRDPAVLARNSQARSISLDTNMDETGALTVANAYLLENKQPRTFELVLEGTDFLPDFVGGPPAIIPDSKSFCTDGRSCKVFNVTYDYAANTTTVQVRG